MPRFDWFMKLSWKLNLWKFTFLRAAYCKYISVTNLSNRNKLFSSLYEFFTVEKRIFSPLLKPRGSKKPRRQVGSYSRKPAQFPALMESLIYGPRRYPLPPANREAVGYHRKITYAEAHVYPARRFTPRVWEHESPSVGVPFSWSPCSKAQANEALRGERCVSSGTEEGRGR